MILFEIIIEPISYSPGKLVGIRDHYVQGQREPKTTFPLSQLL